MCSQKWARPGTAEGSDVLPTCTSMAAAPLLASGSLCVCGGGGMCVSV